MECPAGTTVVGGGGGFNGSSGMSVEESRPVNNGWWYKAKNTSGLTLQIHAVVICADVIP